MKIGSLFSGAGMLETAVQEVFGGDIAWQCETDTAATKLLATRFPGIPNLGDVSAIDWTKVEPVDILTAGFPCQDVSAAGRRAGLKRGTRSGLWVHYVDAIAALRPQYVIVENVRGLLSARANRNMESDTPTVGDGTDGPVLRAAGAICGDLADLFYDAVGTTISAASVGAPHGRERVFILAIPTGTRPTPESYRGHGGAPSLTEKAPVVRLPTPATRDWKGADHRRVSIENATKSRGQGGASSLADVACLLPTPVVTDAASSGRRTTATGVMHPGTSLTDAIRELPADRWGKYGPAIRRWEAIRGPAPAPTEPNSRGKPRLNPRFSEWMMDMEPGWVTDLPISRPNQMRILGNSVVKSQAVAAIRQLLDVIGGVDDSADWAS